MAMNPDELGTTPHGHGVPRPATLAERIHDQLSARIAQGEFAPSGRLPGEHELARRFGVSRPIVREALDRLRRDGTIYSRQGAGSFVATGAAHRPLGFAPVETIADIQRCYEFRITVEPEAAFHAASRHNEAALAAIAAAIALLHEATRKTQHREDADFAFHLAVAEASNNHYFATALSALRNHVSVGMKLHGLALMGPNPRLEDVFREHCAVHAAIRDHDPERAREAMRSHLEGSRNRLFEGRLLNLALGG
jgi:GntR family transcriptional repressor for pyruvate dehydrogenase complex